MIHLVVMEGDGIGPEITAATLDVLGEADRIFGLGSVVHAGVDRACRAAPRAHHVSRRRFRGGQGRRRRHPRAGVAQRLSAGGRGRAQPVGRAAQAARSVRQHPPRAHPRRLSAALRRAGRSGDRAREHRGLLRRSFDVRRPRRIHADARPCAVGAQDHARGLDPDRRGGLHARPAPAQEGHRRAQGERAAGVRWPLSRMRACEWRRAITRSRTRKRSSTR